jgi:putative ABC transport system substrate-binding protein
MRRREVIVILGGGVVGWSLAARAQQKAMRVIGFLGMTSPGPYAPSLAALRQGLGDTGYVEGQNVAIELRWAEGHYDRLPPLAADFVSRKVDVIATNGMAGIQAAKSATSTIPIVFTGAGDPVADGLVASLARPGGNLTGFSFMSTELALKRFELLSELVPKARVIALLVNRSYPYEERIMQDVQEAARARGVQLPILKSIESEIDAAFATLDELQAGALLVVGDPVFFTRREQLVALASRHAPRRTSGFRNRCFSGSHWTLRWRRESAANSSLKMPKFPA